MLKICLPNAGGYLLRIAAMLGFEVRTLVRPRASPRPHRRLVNRAGEGGYRAHTTPPGRIIYASRLSGEGNIALFDLALAKVEATATPRLIDCRAELARIINELDLPIILRRGTQLP